MVAMVSVSNVFANGSQSALNGAINEDTTTTTTTATDTVDTQDNNTQDNNNTNENVTPADSSDDTAMQLFSDTTGVEPTTADSSNVA